MGKRFAPRPPKAADEGHFLDAQPARDEQALVLPVASLKPGRNPRGSLGNLEELMESVKSHGILNPLLVAKTARGLEVIGGHRRFEVAKRLGLKTVPVRLIQGSVEIVSLIDNLCREQLSGWETCKAIHGLMPLFEGNQSRVAEAIQKSRSYVSQAVAVVEAQPNVQRVEHLSLRELFQQHTLKRPIGERKQSGPIAGGRYVTGAIQFRERKDGGAFSLRLNFDAKSTPPGTRAEIIARLEEILKRLRGG